MVVRTLIIFFNNNSKCQTLCLLSLFFIIQYLKKFNELTVVTVFFKVQLTLIF